jgi:ubiquinone/menaquinone biosynthesis C-methylase UbiE
VTALRISGHASNGTLAMVPGVPVRLPTRSRRPEPTWPGPPIRSNDTVGRTVVEDYWNEHTVNSTSFRTARDSARYLEGRARQYPLFREYMDIPGAHAGESILDYGCGPGDDLVEFSLGSGAARITGVDASRTALGLAAARLSLHAEAQDRVELVHVPEGEVAVPLPDGSVDYVHSGGVIHHTSDPATVLRELRRLVKPGGRGRIMVYNRHSVWFQLFVPYILQLRAGKHAGLSVEDAFERTTDGEDCPISRAYAPDAFVAMCRDAGFDATFVGGYFHRFELRWMRHARRALADDRLPAEHREFITALERDDRGRPTYRGRHAGIGGCYVVTPI